VRLRIRVLAAAALIAAVSLLTFGVLLNGLQDQRDAAARGRATTDALNSARELRRLTLTMESDARGFLLTGNDTFRKAFERARDAIGPIAAKLARTESDPGQRRDIADVTRLLNDYASYLDTAIASGSVAQDTRRFDAIDAALAGYTADEAREQLAVRAESNRLRNRAITIAVVGLVLLLVLIAVIAYAAERAIVEPAQRLESFARARHLAELDTVFGAAPIGLAFLDPELRVLRANDAFEQDDALLEPARRVAATGEPVLDLEVVVRGRTLLVDCFAVRGEDGELLAIGIATSDVTARRRAESARERLQSATAALASASSVEEVAAAMVDEATRSLESTTAAVHVLAEHGGTLRHVGGLSGDRLERWSSIPMGADLPLTAVVRSGEAHFFDDVDALLDRAPSLTRAVSADSRSFAVLPLVASGRVLGALSVTFTRPMAFDDDERALLLALASQSAVALARAQLYEREHAVAQTLQASLLPRALPAIEGFDIAGRLVAGAPGVDVGGDFYDAFEIADGIWGLAIGDVCGKGVDAAALTSLARHTLRAAAHERATPSDVLELLNRAVLAENKPGQFLTAIFARLEALPDGRFRLVFACGGHPPPVVLDAGLESRPLRCAGTLLGVVEDPELGDATVELDVGDTLLLYTDGLTEAGAPSRLLTTEDVARLLASVRGETASQTAEGCLREALAASGGAIRDDTAVLVAQVGLGVVSTAGRSAAGESSTRGQ
jgi:serine phosphatase RsbU (regulator of sigma subunit)/CHASE3 domain sensor protein/putative methionine-R-sulfoxide reductase with GAF domain